MTRAIFLLHRSGHRSHQHQARRFSLLFSIFAPAFLVSHYDYFTRPESTKLASNKPGQDESTCPQSDNNIKLSLMCRSPPTPK